MGVHDMNNPAMDIINNGQHDFGLGLCFRITRMTLLCPVRLSSFIAHCNCNSIQQHSIDIAHQHFQLLGFLGLHPTYIIPLHALST
jgi:hypothetical protein